MTIQVLEILRGRLQDKEQERARIESEFEAKIAQLQLAMEELQKEKRAQLRSLEQEIVQLQQEIKILEEAQRIICEYGVEVAPLVTETVVVEGVVSALTAFLVDCWRKKQTFKSRRELAEAAVHDPRVKQHYRSAAALAGSKILDSLLEQAKAFAPTFLATTPNTVHKFIVYLTHITDSFRTPRGKKEGPPSEYPDWSLGSDDPLNPTAQLVFAAMLPIKDGRLDYESVPTTLQALNWAMTKLNQAAGGRMRRFDIPKHGLQPLDKALKAASDGNLSLLGPTRVNIITKMCGFASVEAFYKGHFKPLMEGREVSNHKPGRVVVDPQRHLAMSSHPWD